MSAEMDTTRKSILTPFNIIATVIVIVGLYATFVRFTQGLDASTNLSDYNPWGIWIGFDLLVGVALAAGGYVTSAAVYIFGLKRYHAAVRPAILTGFFRLRPGCFCLALRRGPSLAAALPVFSSEWDHITAF